jgi:hypothetical protein
LGADQFSWYLATSQLTEYLYDKTVISVTDHTAYLATKNQTQPTALLEFYQPEKPVNQPFMIRMRRLNGQGSGGHAPIITGILSKGTFSLINDRILRLTVRLRSRTEKKGVIYEVDLPIAGPAPPSHDPPDRVGSHRTIAEPVCNDCQPGVEPRPSVA